MLDLRGYHEPRVERDKHLALLTGGPGRVPGVSLQFRPYAEFAHVYDSNPRGTFDTENAVRYRMNRHGFRGADISREKPYGVRTTRSVLWTGFQSPSAPHDARAP